jgi:anaerobic magnesium-protoporphyrin IX monomethyl ester cyclase
MTKDHRIGEIGDNIARYQPDIIATTAYTSTIEAALEVLTVAKERCPWVVTVIGGVHPTFCYREVLTENNQVDYVIRGEGEVTLRELVQAAATGSASLDKIPGIAFRQGQEVVTTEDRPFIPNLDVLEPAWELVDWSDYTYHIFPGSRLAVISTSRGCQHDCQFCSQRKFWQQSWRARSVESVTGEIELLHKQYGVDVILIANEYPTHNRQRWEGILDWLIDRQLGVKLLLETRVDDIVRDEDIMDKYRRAGVVHIYIGVEATSQAMLDLFKKGIGTNDSKKALDLINHHGMITETSFVLGTPEETKESIAQTLELAKVYNPDFAHFLLLAPWPYADMYDELAPHVETYDYREYNLVAPVIKPIEMTRDELFKEVLNCYQSFYFYKLPQWTKLKAPFKRNYALKSMKVILNNSFITQHVPMLGTMPKKVRDLVDKLGL